MKALLLAAFAAAAPAGKAGPQGPPPASDDVVASAPAPPSDAAWRAALSLVYAGSTDTALARLEELARGAPDDPLGLYLQALALCWKIEERPQTTALDRDLQRLVDRALAAADARLRADPNDARALLARGGAYGARSRLALFRRKSRDAARAAARMREDLLRLHALEPESGDALFGIGLYDYYADVLPRLMKLLRLLVGLPGGDRARGLQQIEAARSAFFHGTEVQAQLYEIYAFYEKKPDQAHEEIRALQRRYPDAPLWALKRAEHERERLGHYAGSAEVAREILAAGENGHPNFASPVLAALARLALGEALLADLRFAEARRALLAVREGAPADPGVDARARLLLGRCLELEGDREAALVHYRAAADAADRTVRKEAQQALSSALPRAQVAALQQIAEGRRLREAGHEREAAEHFRRARVAWPSSQEAALWVAEDELAHGRVAGAREIVEDLLREEEPHPPWVRPWTWLLVGRLHDLAGERTAAIQQYKKVWETPWGRDELRDRAAAGMRRAYTATSMRPGPGRERSLGSSLYIRLYSLSAPRRGRRTFVHPRRERPRAQRFRASDALECPPGAGFSDSVPAFHSLRPCPSERWTGRTPQKVLDKAGGHPYPTPSM